MTTLKCPYIFSACEAKLCLFTTGSSTLFPEADNPKGLIWQPEQEMSDTQGPWSRWDAQQYFPDP